MAEKKKSEDTFSLTETAYLLQKQGFTVAYTFTWDAFVCTLTRVDGAKEKYTGKGRTAAGAGVAACLATGLFTEEA